MEHLKNELSSIRQRTSLDLEEIRRNTKDLYEREIRQVFLDRTLGNILIFLI